VKTELDLGDRSEWIGVECDLTLCELHNKDVGILCAWPNFGKKSCVFVSLILIYFMFLFKICSCLEFGITLEFSLLLVIPVISLSSILSSLLSKWFYYTSIGAATGAAHCDSFVGNDFGLLVVSYG
jgi:hypothetical protein